MRPPPPSAASGEPVPGPRTDTGLVIDLFETRRLHGVLLDLDGTLVDSTAVVERSWVRWADEFAVPAPRFVAAYAHGRPARDIVADLVAPGLVAAGFARILEMELSDVEGVVALPGAAELLASLPAGSWTIVTSCTHDLAAVRVAACGLPMPASIVTADRVTRGKPDPEPYLTGAGLLGLDPAACLAVEDAPAGLASAVAAGCATVAVTTTYPAAQVSADLVVDTLADLQVRAGRLRLAPP